MIPSSDKSNLKSWESLGIKNTYTIQTTNLVGCFHFDRDWVKFNLKLWSNKWGRSNWWKFWCRRRVIIQWCKWWHISSHPYWFLSTKQRGDISSRGTSYPMGTLGYRKWHWLVREFLFKYDYKCAISLWDFYWTVQIYSI